MLIKPKNKKTPGGRRVEPPLYHFYHCCTPRSGVFWVGTRSFKYMATLLKYVTK